MPVETSARPRPSRLRRQTNIGFRGGAMQARASHFQYFSSSLALCRIARDAVPAQLPGAHAVRVAAARKHAQKRHARAARRQRVVKHIAQVNRAARVGAVEQAQQPFGIGLELLDVVHGHDARGTDR